MVQKLSSFIYTPAWETTNQTASPITASAKIEEAETHKLNYDLLPPPPPIKQYGHLGSYRLPLALAKLSIYVMCCRM
jgi:hypothetical protein